MMHWRATQSQCLAARRGASRKPPEAPCYNEKFVFTA